MKTNKITCDIARNYCCIEALKKLGYYPSKRTERQAWYLSPFRNEKEPSFKVDMNINRWYDHGAGIGGNVIDLICLIQKTSIEEALHTLSHKGISFSFQQPHVSDRNTSIQIERSIRIKHPALNKYLKSRGIQLSVANIFCKEVHYSFKGKSYFAIGLKNNSGGYELRNKLYKNSSSPKDITLIKNGKENLVVCEGMFDLLSLAFAYRDLSNKADILVLNSISFTERAIPIIVNYKCTGLYLDRDNAGINVTNKLLKSSSNCIDMSSIYEGFNDMNDWWMNRKKGKV